MSTDWKEIVAPDEAERFARYAALLGGIQAKRSGDKRRALHNKQLAGVRATFTVLPDIPEKARTGIFAEPKTYEAWVRFSNGSPAHQHDKKRDVRGFAVKVMGVPGRKILPGLEDAKTQDFLLIDSPATPFKNTDEFVTLVMAAQTPAFLLPKLFFGVGFGRAIAIIKTLAGAPKKPRTLVAPFWSALAIRLGAHAVHYAVRPVKRAADSTSGAHDYLREDLFEHLARGPVEYDFFLQFYVNAEKTPIEDASVEWREEDAPFVKVARLTLIKEQGANRSADEKIVESLSFDPWHAPEELRPLGDLMRARREAYKVSAIGRNAAAEPEGWPNGAA